jgi:hypothetical protein
VSGGAAGQEGAGGKAAQVYGGRLTSPAKNSGGLTVGARYAEVEEELRKAQQRAALADAQVHPVYLLYQYKSSEEPWRRICGGGGGGEEEKLYKEQQVHPFYLLY